MTTQENWSRDHIVIGGHAVPAAGRGVIEVSDPATGKVIGTVPMASTSDADAAFAAARRAQQAPEWAGLDPQARIALVERMATELEADFEAILRLVTREMGVPLTVSRVLHGQKALESIRQACAAAAAMVWSEPREGYQPALVCQRPIGTVVAIAPWNGPFLQALYKIVYPILAGCPVIFKPSPETPLDCYYVAEAFARAGLPEGVLSILPGGIELGQYLVAHPATAGVFFTGSTRAGRDIGRVCGEQMKRMVLELGGKSAAILCEDADLDAALPFLVSGAFGNTGQNCAATSRILVPRARMAELEARMAAAAGALVVGDPTDPATNLGPLISEAQRTRVHGHVVRALEDGARLVLGGRLPAGPGWFYPPTILGGVDNRSAAAQDEIFGPVVCLIPYDDEAGAIAMANDSEYGLHGAIFTAAPERATAMAAALQTGTLSVNGFVLNGEAPFGGVKQSGVGRKYGVEGLREWLYPQTINLGSASGTFSFRAPVTETAR